MISVILTTYNRKERLKKAVSAILNQKNIIFELNIIDDYSTDGTIEYLKDLEKKYQNIKLHLKTKNYGLAHSRNIGVKMCKYEYIAFSDDDDIWIDKEKLFKQHSLIKGYANSILCGPVKTSKEVLTQSLPVDWKKIIIFRNGYIHTSTVMMRKSDIALAGGFDEKLRRGIDSDIYRTLIHKHKFQVLFLKDPMVYYETQGIDRITSSIKRHYHLKQSLYQLKKYLYISKDYPLTYFRRIYVAMRELI